MTDDNNPPIHSMIIRYLVSHTQCSGCGQRYDAEDVRIHDHRGHIWLASVTCRECGLQGLVMAAVKTEETRAADSKPDAEEWAVLKKMGPISTDEVLDFHSFLQEFQGDMALLLEKDGRQP